MQCTVHLFTSTNLIKSSGYRTRVIVQQLQILIVINTEKGKYIYVLITKYLCCVM